MPSSDQHGDSDQRKEIVVFMVRRETRCGECERELHDGDFLRMEGERPLCLDCADLGHLEFLPSGDTALTRRATRHSPLRAVVVRWARARNRYERQGILVTRESIEKAHAECAADRDRRAVQREKAAERRAVEDTEFVQSFGGAIRRDFPGCPPDAALAIAAHACRKHSGRVGRSAAAKALDTMAVRLAVTAHVRHEHTAYDERLMEGMDRESARASVREAVKEVLRRWEIAGTEVGR
jgi:hypothetical protein